MRLIGLVAALMVAMAAPAEAAWSQYINREAGFGVNFPGEPTVSKGEYRAAVAGRVESTVYSVEDRGINFSVSVVDFSDRLVDTATILQEFIYIHTRNLNIVSDDLSRAEPRANIAYGRRITEDRPDGSRSVTAVYLTKGNLYIFEALIPAGGDKGSPMAGRFVDSVVFDLDRDWNLLPPGPAQ